MECCIRLAGQTTGGSIVRAGGTSTKAAGTITIGGEVQTSIALTSSVGLQSGSSRAGETVVVIAARTSGTSSAAWRAIPVRVEVESVSARTRVTSQDSVGHAGETIVGICSVTCRAVIATGVTSTSIVHVHLRIGTSASTSVAQDRSGLTRRAGIACRA